MQLCSAEVGARRCAQLRRKTASMARSKPYQELRMDDLGGFLVAVRKSDELIE